MNSMYQLAVLYHFIVWKWAALQLLFANLKPLACRSGKAGITEYYESESLNANECEKAIAAGKKNK